METKRVNLNARIPNDLMQVIKSKAQASGMKMWALIEQLLRIGLKQGK